jgi:hypothetical protein
MKNERTNEPGIALGLFVISVLVVFGVLPFFYGIETGPIKKGPASILLAVYIQSWGLVFWISYYFSHKSFFFRGVIWVCEELSWPKSRFMALLYGIMGLGMGTVALIKAI